VLCYSRERGREARTTNQPTSQPACISMDGKRVLLICALLPSLSPSSKPIQACPKKLTFPFIYKTSERGGGGCTLIYSTVGARREESRCSILFHHVWLRPCNKRDKPAAFYSLIFCGDCMRPLAAALIICECLFSALRATLSRRRATLICDSGPSWISKLISHRHRDCMHIKIAVAAVLVSRNEFILIAERAINRGRQSSCKKGCLL
jgi:hypothetical protein